VPVGVVHVLRAIGARVAGLFADRHQDDDLREELLAHVELETAENIRRGMTPAVAHRQALIASGGLLQATEAVRHQRGVPGVASVLADVRYAWRTLRRGPAFSTVVVVTLALGIGANTAIFSVVRGVLLKPLPHREGDRLVYLRHTSKETAGENLTFSVPEVRDLRTGARSLAGIAEYSRWTQSLRGADDVVRIDVGLVTGNFFDVMGLSPVLGRLTRSSDDGIGAAPVMVLTHEFWKRRFGGDSSVVGKQVQVDGTTVTIIGVVQPAPYFPSRMDALLNMVVSPHHLSAQMVESRIHRMTEVIARLAPGASVAQASADVGAVSTSMRDEHPESYDQRAQHHIAVIPFKTVLGERARATLWLLMSAAAFVMVIAAASVANLTLMRGVRREHEFAVRAALGAGVLRLRRLLLVENLLLTFTGAALGILLAFTCMGLLISLAARYSPRADEIGLDLTAFGFTVALAVAVAFLLSLLSSLPREGTFAAISAGGRRVSGSVSKHRIQRTLVVAQVAVSVVLLAGAGLLTRTMVHLADVNTGLRTEDVLTVPVPLLDPTRASPEADAANKRLYDRMRREVRALPGVTQVALGSTMPLRRTILDFDFKVEGTSFPAGVKPHAEFRTAGPEYFRAAGIPLRQGREFLATDQPGSGRVVIVNETLADYYFPGQNPVGKRLAFTGGVLRFTPFTDDWRTVVGVVGDTRDGGLEAERQPVAFMPFAQEMAVTGGLVIRADSNVAALATTVTRIVRGIAPGVPIENVLTVAQIKDQSVAPRRLNAVLVSLFGVLALIIATVGIGGVLAFSVSARTTEIGIRISLGASSGRVLRMILREGGGLLALGMALGLSIASFATRAIRGLLFGVAPGDPATYLSVAALMTTIGLAACWIPARRAARIDPVIAMRAG
jgi:predicted permease